MIFTVTASVVLFCHGTLARKQRRLIDKFGLTSFFDRATRDLRRLVHDFEIVHRNFDEMIWILSAELVRDDDRTD